MTQEYYFKEHWYDNEIKNWHYSNIQKNNANDLIREYQEIVRWLFEKIDNPGRHARWRITKDNGIEVKFRYEKDYVLFKLRWL